MRVLCSLYFATNNCEYVATLAIIQVSTPASERSLLQLLNTSILYRSHYLRRKRKHRIHFRAFIWFSTFMARFYCEDVSCFWTRYSAISFKRRRRRLSDSKRKVLKHVLCSWQYDGSNLQSVNTWRSLRPSTWIRSNVNDIRALFNIHVFRNRMHIASHNHSRSAIDSVLYYAIFSSSFWFYGVALLKWKRRLRAFYCFYTNLAPLS